MTNSNVITNSAEYGLIPQRDFFDKDIAVDGNTDKYYVIENGDFVYNPRKSSTAPYGPFNCYRGLDEGIVSPLYTCLKPLCPELSDYLLWYFRSSAWHSYIYHNGAQGGARHDRVGMTNDLMDGIPINLPCLDEQKKISEFLSLLENRLTAQQKIVDALKSYKRGLLHLIFDDSLESVELYKIVNYCSSANTLSIIEQNNVGEYPVYDAGGIVAHIDKFDFDIGYVAIIKDGSGVGRLQLCQAKSSIIGTLGALVPKGCSEKYLYAVLQNIDFRQFITGMAIPHIYYKDYMRVQVPFPDKNTQNKIEQLLTKYDLICEKENSELLHLQQLKRSLLQALFI